MNIFVVIPTYKEMYQIPPYLMCNLAGGWAKQKTDHHFDIVISDNISNKTFNRNMRQFCFDNRNDITPVDMQFHYITNQVHCPLFTSINVALEFMRHKHFDYYVYCSDDTFMPSESCISSALDVFQQRPRSGIVSVLVSSDNAAQVYPHNSVIGDGSSMRIKLGESTNLHFFVFSRYWMEKYDFKYPDILVSYASESLLTFMCEAIDTEWTQCREPHLHNQKSLKKGKPHGIKGDGIYKGFRSPQDIFGGGTKFGLGFECWRNLSYGTPDPSCYDEQGNCKDRKALYDYIKANLYLPPSVIDYKAILEDMLK